jgi:squalene-hopene/tetraprenyl-beta-curcumene cyclase
MVYMLIVFRILGYPDDHPRVVAAHKHLREFFVPVEGMIRVQPCLSPVWDTGIALHALAETGIEPTAPEVEAAVSWLLSKECRGAADWSRNCPRADLEKTSSWFFEFFNPHYPDVDDTAMVAMALRRLGGERAAASVERGKNWLLGMQNDDGGWAAFDRTTPRPILEEIPFADHNAMQDPSCPDIAGRVLECLGHCGMTRADARVAKAINFIRKEQDASGAWWGRWGVNFVYGTWQVLSGLRAVGQDMSEPFVRRAAQWLMSVQKTDGSFGETPASYDDPALKGKGDSTASQTAWGTMGMMAALGAEHDAVRRGIEWLIAHQGGDGNWQEPQFTGTGFPRVFYLNYHLYRLYFPLMALARYNRLVSR